MKQILAIFLLMVFIISCERKPEVSSVPVPKVIVEKEKTEREQPLPPEVKIKLKKDGKDNYSWELSGSDVDQILRVNEKMRKGLEKEQSR